MQKIINLSKWFVLYYLKFFAKLQLLKTSTDIIGVTGSSGKTSTIYAIEAVLKNTCRLKVAHNANSETGIPLHILDIKIRDYSILSWTKALILAPIQLIIKWDRYDANLIEMGIDGPNPPKNMDYLLSIISPNTGVFLNTQAVHAKNFDSLSTQTSSLERLEEIKKHIAQQKGRLIETLPENGYAILNIDDPLVAEFLSKTKAQVITFGFSPIASVNIVEVSPSLQGTWIKIKYQDEELGFIIPKTALPKSFGYTIAAAISTGISRGLRFSQTIENLKSNLILPKSRASLIPGINNSTIIDSSYNSSPVPLIESLDILNTISPGRKIALLADMNELGIESRQMHELVARKALQICDRVFLVGSQMIQYAAPILGEKAKICSSAKHAAIELKSGVNAGDTILIKGSQDGLFLEYAVEKLMRDPANAEKILCRRGLYWNQVRSKFDLD